MRVGIVALIVIGLLVEKERKKKQALLEAESLAAVGKAVTEIAHDMKTPLTAIGGFVTQAARGMPEKDRRRKKLEIVVEETCRLENMVNSPEEIVMPELLGVSAGIRDRIPARALRFIPRDLGCVWRILHQVQIGCSGFVRRDVRVRRHSLPAHHHTPRSESNLPDDALHRPFIRKTGERWDDSSHHPIAPHSGARRIVTDLAGSLHQVLPHTGNGFRNEDFFSARFRGSDAGLQILHQGPYFFSLKMPERRHALAPVLKPLKDALLRL